MKKYDPDCLTIMVELASQCSMSPRNKSCEYGYGISTTPSHADLEVVRLI